jgi:hypothetical protein
MQRRCCAHVAAALSAPAVPQRSAVMRRVRCWAARRHQRSPAQRLVASRLDKWRDAARREGLARFPNNQAAPSSAAPRRARAAAARRAQRPRRLSRARRCEATARAPCRRACNSEGACCARRK